MSLPRPSSKIVVWLITIMVLLSFGLTVYRLNEQAHDIREIVEAAQHMTFEFRDPMERPFLVDCGKVKEKYACVSIPPATPTPVATPQVR